MKDVVHSRRSGGCGTKAVTRMSPANIRNRQDAANDSAGNGQALASQVGTATAATATAGKDSEPLLIVASMGTEDRVGDVIEPSGWMLEAYRRNPVFLWAHERSEPPIGRSLSTWVEGNCLKALIQFAPTELAQSIRTLYAGGFMRGISVGFRPIAYAQRKASNGRKAIRFTRQELLEISAAPVPMHPEALASATGSATRPTARSQRGQIEELGQLVSGLRKHTEALY